MAGQGGQRPGNCWGHKVKAPRPEESGRSAAEQGSRNFTPAQALRAIRARVNNAHDKLVRHIADRLNLDQLANLLLLVGFAGGATASTLAHALIGGGQ